MTKARTLADNYAADINQVTASAPLTGGGTSGTVTVGIQDGTTSQKGAVQLEDSTASTSTTKASTPNSVKSAYDLANGAIAKSTVDAKGDLLVGTANDTISRLAVASTAGYVLTVDSAEATGLKWAAASQAAAPTCVIYENPANLTYTGGVNLLMTYTNEETDTDGFHSNTTNTGRITIPTGLGGIYVVTFTCLVSGAGSNYYYAEIQKNAGSIQGFVGQSDTFGRVGASAVISLAAGDYLTSHIQQASTGTFSTYRRFSAVRIGL